MKRLDKALKLLRGLTRNERWAVKQELASPGKFYGGDGTIHGSTVLNVETHHGKVVAVWFRCLPLPFTQHEAGAQRATEMEAMTWEQVGDEMHPRDMGQLIGVEVIDPPRSEHR
jgi:hypothetical protein